ncbi:MAG: alginate export family protein [Chitinophagaceae bacterium]
MKTLFILLLVLIRQNAVAAPDAIQTKQDATVFPMGNLADTLPETKPSAQGFPAKENSISTSFGGETRLQYFYFRNEQWGDAPKDEDGFVMTRFLLHSNIRWNNRLSTFLQLQSSLSNGRMDTSPVDENPLDVHQAYIDYKLPVSDSVSVLFRTGRQEFSYGSQRLISVREGPNNRQAFDAARIALERKHTRLDAFFSYYVAARKGIFDDGFRRDTKLWGAYLVKNKIPFLRNADLYYLNLTKKHAVFEDGAGKEQRHSIGTRIWNKTGNCLYDAEAVYQFGRFASKTISAYTISVNTSYRFKGKYMPEIGIKTELISGDKTPGDERLQTFNPLFPRGAYFGLAALIGPANLIDFHPYINLSLHRNIDWGIDLDLFRRYSAKDGLYAPNTALIYQGAHLSPAYIGSQLATNLEFRPGNKLSLTWEFTWFNAGPFLRAAGNGKDIIFTAATLQYNFLSN